MKAASSLFLALAAAAVAGVAVVPSEAAGRCKMTKHGKTACEPAAPPVEDAPPASPMPPAFHAPGPEVGSGLGGARISPVWTPPGGTPSEAPPPAPGKK